MSEIDAKKLEQVKAEKLELDRVNNLDSKEEVTEEQLDAIAGGLMDNDTINTASGCGSCGC